MIADPPCIFHVGLPKTGTTFLQKRWFPGVPGFDYYSTEPPYRWPPELQWIFQLNQAWFRSGCVDGKREWKIGAETLSRMVAMQRSMWLSEGRTFRSKLVAPTIFSSEGLAGHSLRVNAIQSELIREIFGHAKIIFVFRKQTDWLISLWRQLILVEDRFSRYVSPMPLVAKRADGTALIDMDWRAYVQTYDDLFGAANVLALPYEQMVASPEAFVAEIAAFIGAEPNAIVDFTSRENTFERDAKYVGWRLDGWLSSETGYWIRRTLRRPGVSRRLRCSPLARVFLREHPVEAPGFDFTSSIDSDYEESNRRLGERIGKDLSAYGYYRHG